MLVTGETWHMAQEEHKTRRGSKKRTGCLLPVFVLLVLLLVTLVSFITAQFNTGREIERELSRLEESGVMPSAYDMQSVPARLSSTEPPPEEYMIAGMNAAETYADLSQYLPDERRGAINKVLREVLGYELNSYRLGRKAISELTPEDIRRLRELVAENEDLINAMITASREPYCEFGMQYDVWPWKMGRSHLFMIEDAARLVGVKALLTCKDGHPDEAIELCSRILGISNHLYGEKDFRSQGSRLGIAEVGLDAMRKIVDETDVSDGAARSLMETLERSVQREAFVQSMTQACLAGVDAFDRMRDRVSLYSGETGRSGSSWYDGHIASVVYRAVLLNNDELTYVRAIEGLANAVVLPYYEGFEMFREELGVFGLLGGARYQFGAARYPFACAMVTNAWFTSKCQADHEVNVAQAETVLSLRQYVRGNGTYPDRLDALVPSYLEDVPIDSFSGDPLIYRRDGAGFVLYSVGANLVDDNGVFTGRYWEGDIVWRMDH